MMPEWLQQCPISKDPMSPGGDKTRLITFNMKNRHGTSVKRSLVQSLLQSTDSPMPYSGYTTLTLTTSKAFQSSMDGSLNSFDKVISQISKPDSHITKGLCPCGSDATSPYCTQYPPLLPSGLREPQTSIQWQTSTEKWTRVAKNEKLGVQDHKWKFDKLSTTPPESPTLKTLKTLVLQLM